MGSTSASSSRAFSTLRVLEMDMLTSDWVSAVGFPIAVAAYLLVRVETTVKELRDEIKNLASAIGSCPLKRPPPSISS